MTLAMVDGVGEGPVRIRPEPRSGRGRTPNLVQRGLAKLEWLVVRDFAMTETADFWLKGSLVAKRRAVTAGYRHRGVLLAFRHGGGKGRDYD